MKRQSREERRDADRPAIKVERKLLQRRAEKWRLNEIDAIRKAHDRNI